MVIFRKPVLTDNMQSQATATSTVRPEKKKREIVTKKQSICSNCHNFFPKKQHAFEIKS